MRKNIPYLDDREVEILNTPFAELTPELRAMAFSISDKIMLRNLEENKTYVPKPAKVTIQDRDKLLMNGIKSPIDGKSTFTNRREWANHLKANGCTEIGNDYNNLKPPKEIKGDFDCRNELAQATHQIMDKYGH